jgi:Flp pilus assembly protein TadB
MAVSGHRTRSVFDRYSLSLKAQTRAALERVTAYAEEATAAGVVRRFRRRKNTDTDTLTDTLAKRRRNQAGQSAPSARLPESG